MLVNSFYKLYALSMACLVAMSAQSCAQVDVANVDMKKMTYKALRQHDCRMNEPNAFCERGFSSEFEEYERLRENFLREDQTSSEQASIGKQEFQALGIPR